MRPKATLLFAFVAVSWGTLLLASPPGTPENAPSVSVSSVPCCGGGGKDATPDKDRPKKNSKNSYWVCPIYCYAFWGEYCSYYSEKCDNFWVSMDGECGLPSVWPCDPKNPACVEFGGGPDPLMKREKALDLLRKKPHASKGRKKGLENRPKSNFSPKHQLFATQKPKGVHEFVYNKKGHKCTVKLFEFRTEEITIKGKTFPAQTFHHGIEVEPVMVHDGRIENKDIIEVEPTMGKICTFKGPGGNNYQCIVHKSITIEK